MSGISSCSWGAFLYVIGFSDGRIKVGRTCRPRARFLQHAKSAEIEWMHLFASRISGVAEYGVVKDLARVGARAGGREIFAGLAKQHVIDVCRAHIAVVVSGHHDRAELAAAERERLDRRRASEAARKARKS